MKAVLILAALQVLSVSGTVPQKYDVKLKAVDGQYSERHEKVMYLMTDLKCMEEPPDQSSDSDNSIYFMQRELQYMEEAEDWCKIGHEYNVEANIDNYTNKKAVEEFLLYYKSGFMPKYKTFSIFYDKMRQEAIVLFKLFYYAKDFETFYKTAAFARVHFNDDQFLHACYMAIYQRPDTKSLVLPAPYEMYPQYFTHTKTLLKAYRMKIQNGDVDPAYAATHGIFNENGKFVFYSNYSSSWLTGSEEDKLSYFTEDIGMNSYYYYFQTVFPLIWNSDEMYVDKFRGDFFYFTYQQLIAKYYLNRLSNGLGEIPEFSWYKPIKTGYYCQLSSYYPFFSRNEYYHINKAENEKYISYLDSYEKSFLYYLEQGYFKAYNKKIDLRNPNAIDFVSNYWFSTVDLYGKHPKNYKRYYELIGLHLLSGTPEPMDKYNIFPSALELYQTSLRDPAFYQFYARILNYFLQWKEYLEPYSHSELHFKGVKISDVKIEKLVTFFEPYDFDIINDIFQSTKKFIRSYKPSIFTARQPRLNHKPFTVTVDVKSDVAIDAVFKFFLGPKYDSNGYPLSIEDNWMNFIELDWFVHKLAPGQNKIERHSREFVLYKEDSVPVAELFRLLKQSKVPVDMSEKFFYKPKRMMLPKGTKDGFPFQLYVVVYPHTPLPKEIEEYKVDMPDVKPRAYPFDRPVYETYFKQPNIYREDVFIFHAGEDVANNVLKNTTLPKIIKRINTERVENDLRRHIRYILRRFGVYSTYF